MLVGRAVWVSRRRRSGRALSIKRKATKVSAKGNKRTRKAGDFSNGMPCDSTSRDRTRRPLARSRGRLCVFRAVTFEGLIERTGARRNNADASCQLRVTVWRWRGHRMTRSQVYNVVSASSLKGSPAYYEFNLIQLSAGKCASGSSLKRDPIAFGGKADMTFCAAHVCF